MKLSTKVTYALRAALALAQNFGQEQMTVAQLAQGNNIPKSYLEQILNTLRHRDLVCAIRGPKGGYTLAHHPQEISVGDIVRAVEGELEPILCCFPESHSDDCRQGKDCLNQALCSAMENNFQRILNGTTLQDIISGRSGSLSQLTSSPAVPDDGQDSHSDSGTARKS